MGAHARSVRDRTPSQALPHDVRRRLDPVLHVQLLEGVVNMVLHCALRDRELLADLLVTEAFGYELEDLELPARDGRALRRRSGGASVCEPVLDLPTQPTS